RPSIANISQAIILSSDVKPDFNPLLLDRFLVLVEAKGIKPVVFISKMDMADKGLHDRLVGYKRIYEKIGYSLELFSIKHMHGLRRLKMYFADHFSVIAVHSGV